MARTTCLAAAALLALTSVPLACAQNYPNKPMRWVVPFAAGGGTDAIARPIAQRLSEKLGQPILYDNRGGGGGLIAGEIVARAAPDGYTMLVASVAVMTVNVSLMPKIPFDPVKDFAPITKFAGTPNMLTARSPLPVRTIQELVDYAKANPRKVTWAMSGIGSPGHLAAELFERVAKIDVVNVVYKGAGPATLALLGNEADLLLANPSVFMAHLKTGRLRAIAVASPERLAVLPDVPTFNESGYPGFESVAWFGLAAPARTPAAIIKLLHEETLKVLSQPDLVSQFALNGAYIIGNTPEAFSREVRDEIAKWAKVIKDANIKP